MKNNISTTADNFNIMNEKLIEQIEEMPGVKTVERVPYTTDRFTVVFEPERHDIELVDGEIYALSDRIVRFKCKNSYEGIDTYSQFVFKGKDFFNKSESVGYNKIIKQLTPATKKQKKKLIKAEVKNGFFWELQRKSL